MKRTLGALAVGMLTALSGASALAALKEGDDFRAQGLPSCGAVP